MTNIVLKSIVLARWANVQKAESILIPVYSKVSIITETQEKKDKMKTNFNNTFCTKIDLLFFEIINDLTHIISIVLC